MSRGRKAKRDALTERVKVVRAMNETLSINNRLRLPGTIRASGAGDWRVSTTVEMSGSAGVPIGLSEWPPALWCYLTKTLNQMPGVRDRPRSRLHRVLARNREGMVRGHCQNWLEGRGLLAYRCGGVVLLGILMYYLCLMGDWQMPARCISAKRAWRTSRVFCAVFGNGENDECYLNDWPRDENHQLRQSVCRSAG